MPATAEQALLAQAGPHMLAAQARALIANEVTKGCDPLIWPRPVALEPPFHPITAAHDWPAASSGAEGVYEPAVAEEELCRGQVWIAPDKKFNWNAGELFLKQLTWVSHRVGWEILGNQDRIAIQILCHRQDIPIVATAFRGKFQHGHLRWLPAPFLPEIRPDSARAIRFYDFYPPPPYSHLLTQPAELHVSSYECLIAALALIPPPAIGLYQVLFQPVAPGHNWHRNIEILTDVEYIAKLAGNAGLVQRYTQQAPSGDLRQMAGDVVSKAHNDKPLFALVVRLALVGDDETAAQYLQSLAVFSSLFQHGGRPLSHLTDADYQPRLAAPQIFEMFRRGLTYRPGFLLNSAELTGLVHIPPADITADLDIALDTMETLAVPADALRQGTLIGTCEMAGAARPVRIPLPIRFQHTHLIGKPGKGKSSLAERMILDDITQGHGVALLDPHGDLTERMLYLIPASEVDRVIYFDPGHPDWVPLWNPLAKVPGQDIGRITDDLVGAFKSFVSGWGDRMETMLRQAIFGLLHLSHSTFLDVADLLRPTSPEGQTLRKLLLEVLDTEEARRFWQHDFQSYRADEFGPPKHKLSKLLLSQRLSLMLSQPHNLINFRRIMDDGMILLANLTKIGEESRKTLGSFMLSLFYQTALSRSDTPREQRRPFHLYLDEAYQFPTDSLEEILVQTRKYQVSLTLAHQYLRQFAREKWEALTSVGTTILFNLNSADAGYLLKDFQDIVTPEDISELKLGQAIVRCDTDIVRIRTPQPLEIPEHHCRDQIIAQSRRKYYRSVAEVHQMIRRRDHHQQAFTPLAEIPSTGPPPEFTYDEH